MTAYQPTARRPIADAFRRLARGPAQALARAGVHPDVVSYGSIVASIAAGLCFWQSTSAPWLLLIAPIFCHVRLYLNMLDGMVALESGRASLRGEIVNELPDRVSDILIFAGVAHSGWGSPIPAYWAALMALMTAYVGVLGQAVGARREYGGLMSKPWRMVWLHLGAWTTLAFVWWRAGDVRISGLTILDWTCAIVIAGCVQTVVARLRRILRTLREKAAP
jgi:phosphatidylglycerophosphate synthase